MYTPDRPISSSPEIIGFYMEQFAKFGDSSQGVGWKNDLAQYIRFQQLMKVTGNQKIFSINDFGCGTGELYNFLLSESFDEIVYNGYDILSEMIDAAKKKIAGKQNVQLFKIESANDLLEADYTVASGVFNIKYHAVDSEWSEYVTSTLDVLFSKSRKGFSFNLLTNYSDKEYMKAYLYYADPLFFFDYCKKKYSKNVALLHDYDQFDFTIIVRKK